MKLIWLTDIHLNFLSKERRIDFYQEIVATSGEKILISGDIAEVPSVSAILKEIAQAIQKPSGRSCQRPGCTDCLGPSR